MPSGVAIGTLIGVCFAFGWASAGLPGVPSRWRGLAFVISAVVSAVIGCAVIWRLHTPHSATASGRFNGALYGWAVGLESVAIVVTVIALRRFGRVGYIMPAIAVIVGAHFFGLARAMVSGGGGVFLWVGGSMCILGAAVILALACSSLSAEQTMAFTGFGCATILWCSAVWTLV